MSVYDMMIETQIQLANPSSPLPWMITSLSDSEYPVVSRFLCLCWDERIAKDARNLISFHDRREIGTITDEPLIDIRKGGGSAPGERRDGDRECTRRERRNAFRKL